MKQPKQKRGRETLDRILKAAGELLAGRQFDDITIADIAAKAGVAVGTLYTRFPTKDALPPFLIGLLQDRQLARAPELRGHERWQGVGLDGRVAAHLAMSRQAVKSKHGLLKAIAPRQLMDPDSVPDVEKEKSLKLVGLVSDWLLECGGDIAHPEPEKPVRMAIFMMSVGMQVRLLFGGFEQLISEDDFVEELTKAVIAYLKSDITLPEIDKDCPQ